MKAGLVPKGRRGRERDKMRRRVEIIGPHVAWDNTRGRRDMVAVRDPDDPDGRIFYLHPDTEVDLEENT